MNSTQISSILHSTIESSFWGVCASDKLPKQINKYPVGFVMNVDSSDQPGSHWVAVYIDRHQQGNYFDSYGYKPSVSVLSHFLNANCRSWQCNNKQIQGYLSSVCGHYCIYFLIQRAKGVSRGEIGAKFVERYTENDFLLTEWINDNFELTTDTYNADFILNQVCRALFSQ